MPKRLPIDIDPFRLVEQRVLLSGEMPIKPFARLGELLESNDGVVQIDLAFDRTAITRLPIITGDIKCELELVCQRCLQGVMFLLESEIEIVLVKSDEAAERLQRDYFTWLVEDDRIILRDFIEDEILLALPQVPLHDECEPFRPLIEAVPEEQPEQKEKENPFAILKNLQK